MTPKQEAFVREYLVDLNATQAAIRAGYSAKTAEQQGTRLLRNAQVTAAVQKAMDSRAKRTNITADRVIAELAKIGFADIRKAVKWYSQANVAFIDEGMEGEIEDGSVRIAVANQVELISSDEIDDDTAAAISEISMTDKGSLKVKFHDKKGALELLGKHLKMFTDKVEHTGADGKDLIPARTEDEERNMLEDRIAEALARLPGKQAQAPTIQ
jgi:phage terminase small subunit